jgi:hypothetical protein
VSQTLGSAETKFGRLQLALTTGARVTALIGGAGYSIPPEELAAAFVLAHEAFLGESGALPSPAEHDKSVKIPTSESEAAMMALLGLEWLREHAPYRLKTVHRAHEALSGEMGSATTP